MAGGAFHLYAGVGPTQTPPGYVHHVFGTQTLGVRTAARLALSTGLLDVFGNNFTEPSGGGYARLNTSGQWTVSGGEAVNAVDFVWPMATAGWGTIQSAAIDVNASGALSTLRTFFVQLSPVKTVTAGRRLVYPAGSVTVRTTPPDMWAFSEQLDGLILAHALNNVPFAKPPGTWIALSTTDPGRDGSGISEPVGNGYARVQVPQTTAGWMISSSDTGIFSNASTINWPMVTPASWGTITHAAMFTASTGGTFLWRAPLQTPVLTVVNSFLYFQIGALALRYF